MSIKFLLFSVTTILMSNGAVIQNKNNENDVIQPSSIDIQQASANIIQKYGYPVEEYIVQTTDGYLLTVFRIPYGKKSPAGLNKPIVFVQHGILASSADWVFLGPEKGLAFLLADAGYDVWLGNARGNTQSRKHVSLSPSSRAFWDFSWHEIGQFDLPAMIDFALQKTGQTKLHYVGHSQGTTSFFVMTSLRPEYNQKIRSMHALAPVAFMSHLKSPFVRALAPFVNQVEWLANMLGVYEMLPNNEIMEMGGYLLCRDQSIFQEVCANVLFLIGGFNSVQLNRTALPTIMANTPAGSSVNQLVHYGQGINSGKFRKFDYGFIKNLRVYGSVSPPDYNLGQITAPVALHYSDNDWMADVKDVDQLASKLGNLIGKFRVADRKFNHLDFTWANDGYELLYKRVISIMDRY